MKIAGAVRHVIGSFSAASWEPAVLDVIPGRVLERSQRPEQKMPRVLFAPTGDKREAGAASSECI